LTTFSSIDWRKTRFGNYSDTSIFHGTRFENGVTVLLSVLAIRIGTKRDMPGTSEVPGIRRSPVGLVGELTACFPGAH